ncbi:hypothetical protein [Micromonospora inyonensis]|uniref:Uncharacterized protein n=1 Tax=Micromonospora inyonensis TaxID=47866 RepID=A0A1C6RTY9_9ACTN|nr:hypothetical protein [Micromonospora inyonensis]SCL20478.1 hypothetical protein GA0074694_3050 [Micromonospora inyonensis]SCL25446.1 hypothetical protein GA0074694_4223 [Micromonospora inyonensis]SCL32234.1 hypothetical protein GA0074694_6203 [Micromonospora inyonensis]
MDTITTPGGWGASYDRMSPALRARCDADNRDYLRELAADNQRRRAVAGTAEEQAIRAAMLLAEQQGAVVNPAEVWRTGGAAVGRTKAEALSYYSAVQDLEDTRARRQEEEARAEAQRYHAALQDVQDPRSGRTKAEALRYFSAVQDLEDTRRGREILTADAPDVPAPARYDTSWVQQAKARRDARTGRAR